MPQVTVRCYRSVSEEVLINLAKDLRFIVADALHVDGVDAAKHLRPEDVDVIIVEDKDKGRFSVSRYDITVTVLANDYPERRIDLEERQKRISSCVRHCLGNLPGPCRTYVWVLLAPGAFGEV